MTEALVIVFVKNKKIGTVKTRLAKTIGHIGAFEVYSELLKITEKVTRELAHDKHIYFSNSTEDSQWSNTFKTIQVGDNLGEKMYNAFNDGFNLGYKRIVLIGSDLPTISTSIIENAIHALESNDTVFGPAEDGGYYLIGLNRPIKSIFENKPWSKTNLLATTLNELKESGLSFHLLKTLNDIDTYEDLIASEFYKTNIKLQEKIQQLND
ncbi:TIGR04282 family arsenosugar biosynthesis glycosyltransferase [Winogradskyella alexanderae]|uniref:TIGR04282 family arsenosugar biosynthesis glycosyltransferase n=1 Tax=Winogradskyella alexanderae TaxID=2877123 RepID=A0ABS7XSY5_9FLAO|nr:TIGR04282 family arsenosugar biosynthesis glycosyltransferase [Winogradskyella alexanderae]MCA0132533.1 TIGR04282 family arsenosugar biosynthesis glycosyltransferase [Winogradskyella alexanderae]